MPTPTLRQPAALILCNLYQINVDHSKSSPHYNRTNANDGGGSRFKE